MRYETMECRRASGISENTLDLINMIADHGRAAVIQPFYARLDET